MLTCELEPMQHCTNQPERLNRDIITSHKIPTIRHTFGCYLLVPAVKHFTFPQD